MYCGKDLWEKFGIPACTDHLLPRSVYPQRAHDVDNLVAACADCNAIKRNYDPSKENGKEIIITEMTEITEELRERLINNAKEEIKRKANSDYWKKEFETAKVLFTEAVAKYRACKEFAAAA